MLGLYTFILDADGGTYISQHDAASVDDALIMWANDPDEEVLSAFRITNKASLAQAVQGALKSPGSIVAITGLRSLWFVALSINEVDGFLNVVNTHQPGMGKQIR